ncbi:leucine-rich repeat-containing protein 46 isoform X1 [Centrocercus urophasianus]|uniref:leucine-rich repeat-containing protein 46 isoform X1 n=1 Tax=Centrocercus urophasianus TaxID=9002 RepID=UPI001C64FBC5|nr:leucine-rich repeat-containing protein 46 isoform X1 [Centrocercus urophasianus]
MSAPALPRIPLSAQHKDTTRGQRSCSPAPTVAGEEEALPGGCEQMSLGVTLTDRLMAARSFPGLGETVRPESCSGELPALQTIRLDREDICTIGRLGSLPGIHSLYLQRNRIEKIENLDCFPNLQFLSLAGNCIRKVENLRPLQHLRFLDLSQNQIQTLDADELPRSLRLLDLTGNECTHQPGYRELVVGALPHLLQLDAQPLHGCVDPVPDEKEEEKHCSSSEDSDDELFSELGAPFTTGKDFFTDLQQELAGRSRRRRGEALEEHQARLRELQEHRGLLLPPLPLCSLGTESCLPPSPGTSTASGPGQSQLHPQAKPGQSQQPKPAAILSQPRPTALQGEPCTKGAGK